MTNIKQVLTVFLLISLMALPVSANDPFSRNNYAMDLLNRGDFAQAISQLQDAYHNYPYDEVIKKNLATGYVLAGQKLLGTGQLNDAVDYFTRATELYPDEGELRLFHGIALAGVKKYDYAEVEYERARGLSGESKAYYYHLGKLKYDTGELKDALELWEKGVALDPGDANLKGLLDKARREFTLEKKMAKGYSGRFSVSYDVQGNADFGDDILQILEEAYNKVGSLLNRYPEARVPVLIYTQKQFKDLLKGPEWSGGVYDGKIRLPMGGITKMTPGVKAVLYHEYAHAVIFELTRGNCPMWLNEGIAEYFGRTQLPVSLEALNIAARQGKLLTVEQLEKSFSSLSRRDAAVAYDQSYAFVDFLVTAYGWHKINDLLQSLAKGMPTDQAFTVAFSDYSLNYTAIINEWQVHLAKVLANSVE